MFCCSLQAAHRLADRKNTVQSRFQAAPVVFASAAKNLSKMIARKTLPLARPIVQRALSTTTAPSVQAITYARYGAPRNVLQASSSTPVSLSLCRILTLTLADLKESPSLSDSQVRVEMLYAPISPSDLSTIKGLGQSLPKIGREVVAGHEGVGLVREVGSAVSGVKAGQMVVPAKAGLGTWRRELIAQEVDVAVVPSEVAAEQMAGLLSGAACAVRLISDFGIRAGETVVMDHANGHLGVPFVKVATKKGVKVVCVTDGSIDYANTVQALTDAGALAVIDEKFAEDEAFQALVEHQAPTYAIRSGASQMSGRVLSNAVSKAGGRVIMVDGAGPLNSASSAKVEKWDLGASLANSSAKEILEEISGLVRETGLKQKVEVVGFDCFDDALGKALSRSIDGSILLKF